MPRVEVNQENTSPDYQHTMKMLEIFQDTWLKLFEELKIDPMKFSRLSVVALTQLSAIVAVDIGMSPEQFANVCRAQHEEAYKRAPKFG